MTPLLLALLAAGPVGEADADPAWLHVRGGLPRTGAALAAGGPVRVVFFGGSITERDGFRPLVETGLRAKFPDADWQFQNAGIASTGSTTGAFRFWSDAVTAPWDSDISANLAATHTALVIAEAAVNDDQDERLAAGEAGWGMEVIARIGHRLPWVPDGSAASQPDLMFVHFVNPRMLKTLRAGGVPRSVAAHERVADRYKIPSVNVAAEVARRIGTGTLTWEAYGGTHPGPAGNELAAALVTEAIERGLEAAEPSPFPPGRFAEPKLRNDAPDFASLTPVAEIDNTNGRIWGEEWEVGVPRWEESPAACRDRFRDLPLLHTTAAGATLTFPSVDPIRSTIGLYVLAGPDAGALEVTVPGEEPRTVQLYHDPHSKNLHYPRTVLLYRSDEPPAGPVTVKVVPGERGGTAVRVVGVGLGTIARDRAKETDER